MTLQEILDLADEVSSDRCVKKLQGDGLAIAYVPYESGEAFLDRLSIELGYDPRNKGTGSVFVTIQQLREDSGGTIAMLKIEIGEL